MTIHYEKDPTGVVTLTLDMPDRTTNVVNMALGQALAAAVNRLEHDPEAIGVIVTSAKSTFLAGGDLDWLAAVTDPAEVFAAVEQLKAVLRRLETMGRPVVAALNGSALGGGLELALACHYRLVLDDDELQLGFPEVTLGLMPGGDGVVRLTRMIGLQAAFPFLAEGRLVGPRQALEAGIVDELVPDENTLLERGRGWIRSAPDASQPWDRPGFRLPHGGPNHPPVAQMLSVAPAVLRRQTLGNYPAPEAIMSAATEGALVDFNTASRIESRYFAQIATGRVAKNMIQAFWHQLNEIHAGVSRPPGRPTWQAHQVGVLGAGMMGHGIAYACALAGLEVVLVDRNLALAAAGRQRAEALFTSRVRRGRLRAIEAEEALARIRPAADIAALEGCDLVIEAVDEDRALKADLIPVTEAVLSPDAILASNTSTLPISSLAAVAQRPHAFVGLHFFSPVHRMRLVEIVVGRQTAERTVARAHDFVRQLSKTPIVVNDARGFYTSRVFGTYAREGLALVAEGQAPAAIEAAGRQAGHPIGPLAVLDEVSLGLAWQIQEQTRADLALEDQRVADHPGDVVLARMVNEFQRLGRRHGAGFYEYPEQGDKYLWPGLKRHFGAPAQNSLDQAEMIDRLCFIQALETVRCLEEGVLNCVAEANIGSVFGWGFAPFKGGTLQFINDFGLRPFIDRSRELARRYGPRFDPPNRLIDQAMADRPFR